MKYFLSVMGMVFIIEGLPYFVFSEKIKAYLTRLLELPDYMFRILGLLSIAAGIILLYLGRI